MVAIISVFWYILDCDSDFMHACISSILSVFDVFCSFLSAIKLFKFKCVLHSGFTGRGTFYAPRGGASYTRGRLIIEYIRYVCINIKSDYYRLFHNWVYPLAATEGEKSSSSYVPFDITSYKLHVLGILSRNFVAPKEILSERQSISDMHPK